jgi:uncharacterized protein YcnI
MNSTVIDLENFREGASKVFTSRVRGINVCHSSKIDSLELISDKITIKIPKDICSINPSFFEGFLCNVITKLKKEGFKNKFSFVNEGEYKIETDLNEGIYRILKNKDVWQN